MHVTVNGVSLHYEVEGQGPTVLLLHPVGLDLSWWQPQVEALRSEFQVLRLDFRGHGESAVAPPPYTIIDLANDAHALLHVLQIPPVHVIGLSLGGMVAQELALQYPAVVGSLILTNTLCTLPAAARQAMRARGEAAQKGGMAAVIEPTLERWFTPAFLASSMVERCRERLLANDVGTWTATWNAIADMDTLARLGEVQVPTLVTTGDADASTPVSVAQVIADHIVGATLRIMPGAPHMAPYQRPELFNPLMLEFLHSVAAQTK